MISVAEPKGRVSSTSSHMALSHIMDAPCSYSGHDRGVSRYLYSAYREVIGAIIEHDRMALSKKPKLAARGLRVYSYEKFGLRNRKILPLNGSEDVVTLLKKY